MIEATRPRLDWHDVGGFVLAVAAAFVAGASALSALSLWYATFDLLANLAPLLLTGAIAVGAISVVARKARVAMALSLIAALPPVAMMAPDAIAILRQHPGDPDGPSIKVLSANVLSTNTNYDAFRQLVAKEQPDILLLQETYGAWRSVIRSLGYETVAGCARPHECNTAVLARTKVVETVDRPADGFTSARLIPPPGLAIGTIDVVSVHLSRPPPVDFYLQQTAALGDHVARFSASAIVAGDFNATPWSYALRSVDGTLKLDRKTRFLFSWPRGLPIAPVDQVYAGSNWEIIDIRRGPDIGSDHYPIVAVLALRDGLQHQR